MRQTVSRFAPSPTGLLHAGNYRTAVFAYLFAKHTGGLFIVRIEDTDSARSKPEYEQNILEALKWLELPYDKLYRQSDHRARHRELLEKMVADKTAYVSKESRVNPTDREEVIRFKNPGGSVTFTDVIHGEITTPVDDLGDFIIARSFDEPVFHFAVVVDDADEDVTHVIRGGDHISNTARQILIQRALKFPEPLYAHLPLIMDSNHKKLSKRHGARALTEYRDLGILPSALLNYLAFLGWNPGDDREYLSRDELVSAFDLSRVQKGSAVFDEVKLYSVNQHWMRALTDSEFLANLGDISSMDALVAEKAVPLLKERSRSFTEARLELENGLRFLFERPELDKALLVSKETAIHPGLTKSALEALEKAMESLPEGLSAQEIKESLMPIADAEEALGKGGRGAVLWPLRYAISGQERSPDPFTLISIISVRESIERIKRAIAILEG